MEVLPDARACSLSEIHSDIEPVRRVQLLQDTDDFLGELHHFCQLIRTGQRNRVEMPVWGNHDMTRSVRKQVENDEIVSAAKKNQPAGIVSPIATDAKDAR